MNREMRRNDRQLTEQEATQILERGEYGILSTVCTDGTPYGLPVSYAYQDGVIYFHCAKDVGLKIENITAQPKVCFTVVDQTEVLPEAFATRYESAIAFGAAQKALDKRKGLILLQEKYSPDYSETGAKYIEQNLDRVAVYEIRVESLTGKGRK